MMDNVNRHAYLILKPWLRIHYNVTFQPFTMLSPYPPRPNICPVIALYIM